MVLSTPKFTKIIRLGLLVQLRYYRLGLQPAGDGAGVCRSPRLRKGKGLGGPGTASSPFRKSRGRGGPTRKGAETESSQKAQYGTNATNYGLIFFGLWWALTFFSNKSHLDMLGFVVQPEKITPNFDPPSQFPDICLCDNYTFCVLI